MPSPKTNDILFSWRVKLLPLLSVFPNDVRYSAGVTVNEVFKRRFLGRRRPLSVPSVMSRTLRVIASFKVRMYPRDTSGQAAVSLIDQKLSF